MVPCPDQGNFTTEMKEDIMSENAELVLADRAIVAPMSAREQVENLNNGALTVFSTYKTDDQASKMSLFIALSDAAPLGEHLNETIRLANVVAQVVEVNDENKGITEAIRVILIDDEGRAYAGVSGGLFKAIQNMFQIIGLPTQWDGGVIPVRVVREKARSGWYFHTIKLAEAPKNAPKGANKPAS